MTTITQTIPSLIYGLSQQPDELLLPGQLKEAKNVLLDVASGLQKRPGGQLVGSAITDNYTGKWFAINRDRTEQYIGKINTDGKVEIWSAIDGSPKVVRYQNIPYGDPENSRQSFVANINANTTLAKPSDASCNLTSFTTALVEYTEARQALLERQQQIEDLELSLIDIDRTYGCKEFYEPVSIGKVNKGVGYIAWSNGKFTEINKPIAEANQVVSVGNQAGQKVSQSVVTKTGKYPLTSTISGDVFKWKVCYTESFIASLKSPVETQIATLQATLPALQAAIPVKRELYEVQAAACGYFTNPYDAVTGSSTRVTLSVDPKAVDENSPTNIIYTFTRTGSITNPLTIYYSVGGSATLNVDYVISGDNSSATATDREVTIGAGESSVEVTVNPTGDTTFEDDESVSFTLKADATYLAATTVPVYSGILNDDNPSTTAIIPYLKHTESTDLKTLTINDYTFIANSNTDETVGPGPITMTKNNEQIRPKEAFIELTQIAYGKQYAINLNYLGAEDSPQSVSSVLVLDVARSEWEGTDGECPFADSEVFDIAPNTTSSNPDADRIISKSGSVFTKTGGTWTGLNRSNLRFELTTSGNSVPVNYSNAYEGYKCRYRTEVTLLVGGEGWEIGDSIEVTMSGAKYTIVVKDIRVTQVLATAGLIRPTATNTNSATVIKAEDILNDLKSEIDNNTFGFTTEIIGNGLYLSHAQPFSIETPEAQLMSVFTNQVNNITRLPTQCKDGYTVKVINSAEQEDDYYLRFVTKEGTSGEGVWEETYKPGINLKLNSSTMPHQIVRTPNGEFVVSPVDWEQRRVGDDDSVPVPSFVGKYINGIALYRNRLVLMSDENVIMSRPGDYFNFFAKSAITSLAADPIDIAVGSTSPTQLSSAVGTKAGLLVFGPTEQFIIHTDQDILSPDTVRLDTLCNYKFNSKTAPVPLGTSVTFLGDTGKYSALYEITEIPTANEARVIEQSKLVSTLLPDTLDQLVSSKDYSTIFIGSTGDETVWVFRYFDTGERRIQSAWAKWELSGKLVFHTMLEDGYYAVLRNTDSISGKEVVTIQRFDLKRQDWSSLVDAGSDYTFNIHLDNSKIIRPTDMTYNGATNKTSFYVPFGYYSDKELVVYSLSGGEYAGLAANPTLLISVDDAEGLKVELNGDWTDTRLLVGYNFEMRVQLPKFYVQEVTQSGVKSDTRSSLMIHRVKVNFGDSGIYETTLKRLGHTDYTEEYAVPLYDQYSADSVALKREYTQVVPVYAKNRDMSLYIKSSHPSPATIHSITWEGDYNSRYYRGV